MQKRSFFYPFLFFIQHGLDIVNLALLEYDGLLETALTIEICVEVVFPAFNLPLCSAVYVLEKLIGLPVVFRGVICNR